MDLNLVVLAGSVAVEPEVHTLDNGEIIMRFLVAVSSESPNRTDVVTVEYWGTCEGLTTDSRVHIIGMLQRRYWSDDRGSLRVVASDVKLLD